MGKINPARKRKLYRRLVERDGPFCFWCEERFSPDWPYSLDHLIPSSRGGGNQLNNLVLSCDWCNNKRGDMPAGKFKRYIRENLDGFVDRKPTFSKGKQQKQRDSRSTNALFYGDERDSGEQNEAGSAGCADQCPE